MGKAVLACVLLVSLFVMSCNPPGSGSGGANSTRVVTGTITVPSQPDWANLKLGVFSGGTPGAYPKLGTADGSQGVGHYRVIYDDLHLGAAAPITPLAGASYSISDTSGTSSAYSFELPVTVPMVGTSASDSERYYYAAWIDSTVNGILDLKDASAFDSTTTIQGEFNRCATKATMNTDAISTTITINFFMQSTDSSGNPSGNYKYNGHDLNTIPYNEIQDLTDATNGGFNFNITATSGW